MSNLTDHDVQDLLTGPNYAVLSTQNGNGNILSTVVWVGYYDGRLFVNSALGRRWPTNLERDPHATLLVMDPQNAHIFLEVRGTVTSSTETGTADINLLSNKYVGRDFPALATGERRVTFVFEPSRVRLVKQN